MTIDPMHSSGLAGVLDRPHRVAFFARPGVQAVLPLATSVALHLGILAAGVLLAKTVSTVIEQVSRQQTVPVLSDGPDNDLPSTVLRTPGDERDRDRLPAGQMIDPTITDSEGTGHNPTADRSQALAGVITDTGATSPAGGTIGIGPNTIAGLGNGPVGPGGPPFGRARFGPGDAFDPPTKPGGPVAKRIVYVIDGTGTMVGLRWTLVREQLQRAIDRLQPNQSFSVVLYHDGEAISLDAGKLAAATPAAKRKAYDWLAGVSIRGQTNPLPAIQKAFAQQPELVYFLSDGEFDNLVGYDQVLAEVAKLNAAGTARVNTILVGDRDARAEQTLRELARRAGGTFKFVTEKQLDQ
jgi:hypothetical protein